MSARSWWRAVLAAVSGRWEDFDTAAERDETEFALMGQIADLQSQLADARRQLAQGDDSWRGRALKAEDTLRQLDAQRGEAMLVECPPWRNPSREELERAARHAEVEQTGGR